MQTTEPSLEARRLCAWCQRLLPSQLRPHARTCSKACRQSLSRAMRQQKRRPSYDISLAPSELRKLRGRAVAARSAIDSAAAARRENTRQAFIADAAAELRKLLRELDDAQRRAFEERDRDAH